MSGGLMDDYAVPTRDVPKVILLGLRAAGVKADFAKAWRGGKYPTTLDLAIDIDCPWLHISNDGASFAKVRLLVDPRQGVLTVDREDSRDAGCSACTQAVIDRWLVTCRGHDDNGHPDHEPGWIEVDDFPDDTPDEEIVRILGDEGEANGWLRPDDSPMGHVLRAMENAHREFEARYHLAHPEYVEKRMRKTWEGANEEFVQRKVTEAMERARTLLSTGSKLIGSTEVVIENRSIAESVVDWLAEKGVPPTLGVNATWDRVKNLPGCPTQAVVRDAQAMRKG